MRGSVEAPSSKAYTHRALVTSFLANGTSAIEKPLICNDTERTIEAIKTLGAKISHGGPRIIVQPKKPDYSFNRYVECGESGATFRFLTAVSAAFPVETTLHARGSLSNRPLLPLLNALKNLGATIQLRREDDATILRIQGPLKGGTVSIPGDVSSQFVSGLLLAAPLASNGVEIQGTTKLESRPYVDMTVEIMRMHQVEVETLENGFRVPAPQSYLPADHLVPTDFSSAAFLLAAGSMMGKGLGLSKVRESPIEPDLVILNILAKIGARFKRIGDRLEVTSSPLESFRLDASDHPDLVPVLEVLACHASGSSEIQGIGRLVHKESDRLRSLPAELRKMGAKIALVGDSVVIEGGRRLIGRELSSHHDHRVAMACATASLAAHGTTVIDEAEVVSKSYPEFYGDLERLGVNLLAE